MILFWLFCVGLVLGGLPVLRRHRQAWRGADFPRARSLTIGVRRLAGPGPVTLASPGPATRAGPPGRGPRGKVLDHAREQPAPPGECAPGGRRQAGFSYHVALL